MIRSLLKSPGFTLTVILTLALGIGANTAIFSVVHPVLLAPLPYPEGDRIVAIHSRHLQRNLARQGHAPAGFRELEKQVTSFASVAAFRYNYANLTRVEKPTQLTESLVTLGFFEVFRVKPMLGRTFVAADAAAGAPPVVVLGHGLWQTHFGGRASLVGETITLDDQPHTVIGIMPPTFKDSANVAGAWRVFPNEGGENLATSGRFWSALSAGVRRRRPGARRRRPARRLPPRAPRHEGGSDHGAARGVTASPLAQWPFPMKPPRSHPKFPGFLAVTLERLPVKTLVLALLAATSLGAQTTAPAAAEKLFAVEFTTGPGWDATKPFQDQKHIAEHSANLNRMWSEGRIVMGGRHGEVGQIVVRAADEAALRAELARDPSIAAGTFRAKIAEFRPFFGGQIRAHPDTPEITIVRAALAAYNQHDAAAVAAHYAEDIAGFGIERDGKLSSTGEGREVVQKWLAGYFKSVPDVRAELLDVTQAGAHVSFRERVTWTAKDGSKRTLTSLGIYEVRDGKIRRTWYFPPAK